MPRILKFRRGTTSQLANTLGAEGELFVDTSLVTVVVHNGITTGGVTLARASEVNTVSSNLNTVSSNLNTVSSNLNTVSSNLNTVSSNLNTVSSSILAARTFTTKQTFAGSTTSFGSTFYAGTEILTVTSAVATGIVNFDLTTQGILYTTANAGAAWIVNFRANTTTSLNSIMATGESVSAIYMVTQGATAFFNTSVTIDGTVVTPRWQGGTAPSAGNTSSIDVYAYTIIKTASSTYTVLASQTQFK